MFGLCRMDYRRVRSVLSCTAMSEQRYLFSIALRILMKFLTNECVKLSGICLRAQFGGVTLSQNRREFYVRVRTCQKQSLDPRPRTNGNINSVRELIKRSRKKYESPCYH